MVDNINNQSLYKLSYTYPRHASSLSAFLYSEIITHIPLSLFSMGGGVDSIQLFKEFFSQPKTIHFQGCKRVWSMGHQVRGHPCKFTGGGLKKMFKGII